MILARLQNVSKYYGPLTVLDGVSLEIHSGRRVGVTGRNGTGKTTLFRLLTRIEEPDSGEVHVTKGTRVVMLDQIPDFAPDETVESAARKAFDDLHEIQDEADAIRARLAAEEVPHGSPEEEKLLERVGRLDEVFRRRGGFEIDYRLRAVLHGLGFSNAEFGKPLGVMSGGERNRVALGRLLLMQPDLLLLDEPTNHLDLAAIEWLEGYLKSWEGGFLLISHDRYLLQAVTEETFDVSAHKVTRYVGSFQEAMVQKAEARRARAKQFDLQQKEIKRQEDFVQRNIAGQNYKQALSRRRMLSKMDRLNRPDALEGTTHIAIEPRVQSGKDVLAVKEVRAEIEGRELFRDVSLHVRRGERLGVLGPNGAGKTTLMRILAGKRAPDGGSVRQGVGVMVGFLDQQLRDLDTSNTVLEEVHALRPLADQGEMRGYLARFLFKGDDVFRPISVLSGGERCRVALSKLFLDGPNLIFLDEPTNHLDIDGREALENALSDYAGTVIAVSHDRAFLNAFASTILHLHDGRVDVHLGDFDSFKAAWDAERGISSSNGDDEPADGATRHAQRKEERRARQKARRDRQRRAKRIEALEGEIASGEASLEALVARMSAPDLAADDLRALTEQHRAGEEAKARLYAEWEALAEAHEADVGEEDDA